MPFLRVIRDKRGYETTYLMHWYREGPRQRSRILYVFRTPGGVRVGRDALDPEIQHEIEIRYPEIQFDWHAVLENQQVVEPAPDQRRSHKPQRTEKDKDDAPIPVAAEPAPRDAPSAPVQPRFIVPAVIEGSTPDEQLSFLTRWHAKIRDHIPVRTSDPVRQQVLMALADRLNPVTWTDADQITSGLQQAVEALERLSRVFAKRRRRPRRPVKDSSPRDISTHATMSPPSTLEHAIEAPASEDFDDGSAPEDVHAAEPQADHGVDIVPDTPISDD